jgi:hypothetical protein
MVFIEACERERVPASPILRAPKLIVKHRNEEGGLGLHTFKNAAHGGEWIIQNALSNATTIARLLPKIAPLSTFRLVTASRGCVLPNANATTEEYVQVMSPRCPSFPCALKLCTVHALSFFPLPLSFHISFPFLFTPFCPAKCKRHDR